MGVCGELYSDERFTRLVLPICLEEKSGRAIGVSLIVFNSDLAVIDETMDIDDGIASNGVVKNFFMVATAINLINQT
ncbi:hypothetical protein MOXK02_20950 [Moraxella sp. K02]